MIWWFLGGIAISPVLWFLLKYLVGITAPPKYSGRKFLEREMMRLGVSPSIYGDACLSELINCIHMYSEQTAKLMHLHFSNEYVKNIEHSALVIQGYEAGDLDGPFLDDPIVAILEKHRPIKQRGGVQ